MDKVLFIAATACYLVSLAASLLLSFFYRKINTTGLIVWATVHILMLLLFFFSGGLKTSISNPTPANYFLLSFFCTGIVMAGVVLRKSFPLIAKIYSGAFLSSALLFFFNPSMVIGIITAGNPNAISPHKYNLYENVYLMEQQNGFNFNNNSPVFKITKEFGVFHKTLTRNIILPDFPVKIESTKLNTESGIRLIVHFRDSITPQTLDTLIPFGAGDASQEITRKIRP
ncbi:MAG TPA: hypothetical protein VFW78_11365 [Bacteroidia bacterium]|nr:hypothetical protein [Bacteroidia bacterium]